MRIVLTGANGYIASLIRKYNKDRYEFVPVYRKDVDLENPEAVRAYFEQLDFDVLVHTAADATTAHCEKEPERTHRINTESSIAIAQVCKKRNKRLIFFGTEQSFNGKTVGAPHKETDLLESSTNYGKQKSEADLWIQNNLEDYVILRLSWMMGMSEPGIKASPNILRSCMNAILSDKPTKFAIHEMRGMTYAKHLCDNFEKILALESGVYHFSNTNTHTTYESALIIARMLGVEEERIQSKRQIARTLTIGKQDRTTVE